MKIRQILSLGVLVPVMMAAQPETRSPTRTDSMARSDDPALRSDLIAQEKKVWESMKSKDWTTFENLLADDFTMVCPKGFQDKAQGIDMARKGTVNSYALSDWRMTKLSGDSAVVLYKAECDGSSPDGKTMKGTGFASTIWTRHDGKWVAQLHQMVMEEGEQGR